MVKCFFILFLSFMMPATVFASELKWNCEQLSLKWNEIPGAPGKEFKVKGCWQDKTYFLISADCKQNPKACLDLGKNKSIPHPGSGIGSPAFSLCYRIGGRPRFLQLKVKDNWENTSSCFFSSEEKFMDFDTIVKNQKLHGH